MVHLAVLFVGCGGERGEPECSLGALVDEHIGALEYVDCGHLTAEYPGPERSELEAARDCVIASTNAQQNFVVRWYLQGIEGVPERAYVGTPRDGVYRVGYFKQGVNVKGGPGAVAHTGCATVVDDAECTNLADALCLVCVAPSATTWCEP